MANLALYAAETDGIITHLSGELANDHEAQAWHRDLGNPGTLVVLDLAEGQTASVGDAIDIDADGVATLCDIEEQEPLKYKIFDANPNESDGNKWDSSSGPDAEDYEDAEALAEDALDWAVSEAANLSDYEAGDTLYVIVYRPDGSILQSNRTIDADDLDLSA